VIATRGLELEVKRRGLRLHQPLQSAHGDTIQREVLEVTLIDREGAYGRGEAAPLESYDGVSLARVQETIERYRPALAAAEDAGGMRTIEACRQIDDLPQALAAIELALWDRAGRRAGRPVAELLVDDPSPAVEVNATIGADDRDQAAAQAGRAVADGFRCVKLKVGVGDDAGRVAAVRAAIGPQATLRLDANGAWGVEQAIRNIEALEPAGLELVEEPTHGLEAVREVRERVSTRIAIDETAAQPGALGAGVADAVCLKIGRCGGISGLLAAAALVRASGAEVYLASTLDGPLGVAAALHAAAALSARGPMPPCGLATLALFEGCEDVLPAHEGRVSLPRRAGLGVEGAPS
jgi:L-Ala-D/L-Glu epimerase